MGCGYFTCSRNALISLNVLYILIAILLIGVAAYAKAISLISSLAIIGAVIACGVFLALIACMGFIGAVKHHQICLFFYMVILFILFIIQFSLAVALLAITEDTQEEIASKGWQTASNATKIEFMQAAKCCGFKKWQTSDPLCTESRGCCDTVASAKNSACCGGSSDIDCPCTTCADKVMSYSDLACKITGGIGLFISFTEVVGVWLALRYRNQKDPSADPNAFL